MAAIDRLDNRSALDDRVIQRRLQVRTGAPLDVERLQKDLAALYGDGVFDRVIFSVDETGLGKERREALKEAGLPA